MEARDIMSEQICRKSKTRARDFGVKNALAGYVRRRWPQLTIAAVQAEWGLSYGLARGVVYGTASQTAIDQILKHPRGGWRLLLEIATDVIGHDLEQHLELERQRRDQCERDEARLTALLRGVGNVRDGMVDRGDPLALRSDRRRSGAGGE